jgi:hypothetical protein
LATWDATRLGRDFFYLGDGVFAVGFDYCYSLCGHQHMLRACFSNNMFFLINKFK